MCRRSVIHCGNFRTVSISYRRHPLTFCVYSVKILVHVSTITLDISTADFRAVKDVEIPSASRRRGVAFLRFTFSIRRM
jgi:hypothetical protein